MLLKSQTQSRGLGDSHSPLPTPQNLHSSGGGWGKHKIHTETHTVSRRESRVRGKGPLQGGDWSRAPAGPGKGVMEAQVGWGSPQEAGTPPSIRSRAPSSPWGPSLSSSPSFVLSPVSWVLFIKHKPRQGPPPGKQRSQPPRLWPVFPGPSLLHGPQCGGPARGRCADAHVSVASPLPPPGGVSRLPSVISLLSVSAIRMPRVYAQAPAPAGPAEGLPWGPGHGFAARSPAEHPQQNRRAADPGLGRRL